ncbi:mechanosensitive ion channel [Fictibacillus barbaricus]|uniref:Small-conductance mechanosensitive channel n=1 Tax=Fictibacillus barbaricus TaxID=182136 RepID=A0ABU1U0H2_9BACL|nr:mechanosensitive ion channel [Fictibacillus barbaricus]MDR7072962.1 small-conductance mechanosensitive channel [Fictibacillus barbaricus]
MYDYNTVTDSWMAYLGRLPDLLLAILVLLIGWLIASLVAKAVKGALHKTDFDNKMARWMRPDTNGDRVEQRSAKYSPEEIVSKVVFWILMAVAIVMFLNMLSLPYVAQPISNALGVIAAAIPNILKAVLIAAVAWLIASVLAMLIRKVGRNKGFQSLLYRFRLTSNQIHADKAVQSASKAVFYLTLLLFLPAVLSALGIDAISKPLEGMLNGFFAFIPKLIGAAIILFVGWLVAKIVKEILVNFLQSIGTDRLASKLGAERALDKTSLSQLIGTIVYVFILIPVVISALETLDIKGISGPAVGMLGRIMDMIPNIIVAIILVAAGLWVGKWVKHAVTSLLERVGFNGIFYKMGLGSLHKSSQTLTISEIIGYAAQIVVVLLFTIEALHLVNLESLVGILTVVLAYIPMVLTAVLILGIGFYAGHLVKRVVMSMVKQETESKLLGNIAKYTIITLAFFMALDQLGVAKTIVNAAFILVLGGFTIAFGLAFGLGGRETAARTLNKLSRRMEQTTIQSPDPAEWKDKTKLADFSTGRSKEQATEGHSSDLDLDRPHTIARDRQFNHLNKPSEEFGINDQNDPKRNDF